MDSGLARAGIIIGWAGLTLQVLSVCLSLAILAAGLLGGESAPPPLPEPASPEAGEPPTAVAGAGLSGGRGSLPPLLGVECGDGQAGGAYITRVVPRHSGRGSRTG